MPLQWTWKAVHGPHRSQETQSVCNYRPSTKTRVLPLSLCRTRETRHRLTRHRTLTGSLFEAPSSLGLLSLHLKLSLDHLCTDRPRRAQRVPTIARGRTDTPANIRNSPASVGLLNVDGNSSLVQRGQSNPGSKGFQAGVFAFCKEKPDSCIGRQESAGASGRLPQPASFESSENKQ